jgi:hypothetical protein
MNMVHCPRYLVLAALLLLFVGSEDVSVAQSTGDLSWTSTYYPTTPLGLNNPFCSPGSGCYFTETDIIAGSTTSSEIDVWTSTSIGPTMINNENEAFSVAWIVEWEGYWANLADSNGYTIMASGWGIPTARAPNTGNLIYTSASQGHYYALDAFHCAEQIGSIYDVCFDDYFSESYGGITDPIYTGGDDTYFYFWDGSPQVNQPSTTPFDYPGKSGTITVTGSYFVDPFYGSGTAGIRPVSCDSRLSFTVNSWTYNSSTQVETVVLSYSVGLNATPGAGCVKFEDHFGYSSPITFNVNAPPPLTIVSILPNTWYSGISYPITITGTNFYASTAVGVSVNTGTVALSDVKIIDTTEITATVKPADTDPTETAIITLTNP